MTVRVADAAMAERRCPRTRGRPRRRTVSFASSSRSRRAARRSIVAGRDFAARRRACRAHRAHQPARAASTSRFRSRRSSPSSASSGHPEAVAVHEAGDLRVLLLAHVLLEAREDLLLPPCAHARATSSRNSRTFSSQLGASGAHLVQFVDERLDVAVLAFEMVGIARLIGLAQRRIDDHLFLRAHACRARG